MTDYSDYGLTGDVDVHYTWTDTDYPTHVDCLYLTASYTGGRLHDRAHHYTTTGHGLETLWYLPYDDFLHQTVTVGTPGNPWHFGL